MIKKDNETGIIYRQWDRSGPEAVLLLVHGLGAHTGRWEAMSGFFLQNGISSYALELKGFGETKGPRGHVGSFKVYFDDIGSLRNIITRENPGKKVYLVGESLGALISFLMAAGGGMFDGLVCISPAFKSVLKIPFTEYLRIVFSAVFDPDKQFDIPFDSAMCTRDEEYRRQMDEDEREHRRATAKLLFETAAAQVRARAIRGNLRIPVLFLLSGDDKLTSPATSRNIFEGLKTRDKTLIEYPDMYHSLSIDAGKERVFVDMLKWVRERA